MAFPTSFDIARCQLSLSWSPKTWYLSKLKLDIWLPQKNQTNLILDTHVSSDALIIDYLVFSTYGQKLAAPGLQSSTEYVDLEKDSENLIKISFATNSIPKASSFFEEFALHDLFRCWHSIKNFLRKSIELKNLRNKPNRIKARNKTSPITWHWSVSRKAKLTRQSRLIEWVVWFDSHKAVPKYLIPHLRFFSPSVVFTRYQKVNTRSLLSNIPDNKTVFVVVARRSSKSGISHHPPSQRYNHAFAIFPPPRNSFSPS